MTNPRRRPLIRLIAAVLIWTALSYALISMFSGSHVCALINPHQPIPLTQAEMDAITAGCNRPSTGTLGIALGGYTAIAVWALISVSSPADPDKSEVSAAP